MPIQAIQRSGKTVEIVVGDALTKGDVELVGDALALGPRGANVSVDLRRARTREPAALLRLACVLAEAGARFTFVGLTDANARLLRYLDTSIGSVGASRVPRP